MTSLLEAIGNRCVDVYDVTFDIGCAWSVPDPEETSELYDRIVPLMASKIEFVDEVDLSQEVGYDYRWIVADISRFVWDNMELFRLLASACNLEMTGDDDDDIELAINMVSALVSGNADGGAYRIVLNFDLMEGLI